MAAREPEGRDIRHVGGLELDERHDQRLYRERSGRTAERQSARLRRGEAADIHVRNVQRAGKEQFGWM